MKYHLALDSGGTKVLAVLYDEELRPLRSCRVGSMRSNTTSSDIVQRNIEELLTRLDLDGASIGRLSGVYSPEFAEALRKRCVTEEEKQLGEFNIGLYASETFGDALLATVGTGASFFIRHGTYQAIAGGYGAAIADEGSGYWIGREAFLAAIHDYEGRGPHTMLTDLIGEKLGGSRSSFRERIFSAIYSRDASCSPVMHVAGCAPLVSRAAQENDPAAKDILVRAGTLLAMQLVMLIRKAEASPDLPIALSGSVWRSHPLLITTFEQVLRAQGIRGGIRKPIFEPIVGAVIDHHCRRTGTFTPADHAYFLSHYSAYVIKPDLSV